MLDGIRNSRPPSTPIPSVTSTATSPSSRSPKRKSFNDTSTSAPARPNRTWIQGDWMLASITPTRRPCCARIAARMDLGAGDTYVIEPGHDAWVLGDERFVGFEFESQSAEQYARG